MFQEHSRLMLQCSRTSALFLSSFANSIWDNVGKVQKSNPDNSSNELIFLENIFIFLCLTVPSQPPKGVRAYALSSESIGVAWEPPPLFTLHGVLQGYRVLYKPVRKDEGLYKCLTKTVSLGQHYAFNILIQLISLSISLSLCACTCVCVCVYLSVCMHLSVYDCLSVGLCLLVSLSVCRSVRAFVRPSICACLFFLLLSFER